MVLLVQFGMRIGVTSASGQLSQAIINSLVLEIGKENVVGIARNPSKVPEQGIEVRHGDYNQKEGLVDAFGGLETLLLLSANGAPEGRKQQHANVIDAAKECGVRKVVYTSILGSEEGTDFSPIVASNRHTEKYLTESGLNHVIGRNGIYIEPDIEYIDTYEHEGKVSNCAGEGKCGYTTRSELGYAYSKMLLNEDHNGGVYNLIGEAITQKQLCEFLNKKFKLHLEYEALSIEDYKNERIEALGEFMGSVISGIYTSIRKGAFDVESHYEKAAGRPHIGWEEYFENL